MGSPKQKKKESAQEPKNALAPRNDEFRMEPDLRDPWKVEGRARLDAVPKKQEPEKEGEIRVKETPENKEEPLVKVAKRQKPNFGARIKALMAKMKEREESPKYHRGEPATRPRETTQPPIQYVDRLSRFGSRWGNRPKNTGIENTQKETKKKKKKG